jgi:hypothetical protein
MTLPVFPENKGAVIFIVAVKSVSDVPFIFFSNSAPDSPEPSPAPLQARLEKQN